MSDRPTRCLLCEARLKNPVCQLPVVSIDRFAAQTSTSIYQPGQVLFSQGDPAADVMIIRFGRVKLSHHHQDGTEQVLRMAGPGEVLGIGNTTDSVMMATAIAKHSTTVCRTPMSQVEHLVRTDPDFALAWGHLLMDEIRRAREAVFHLGPHPAGVRLARLLCQIVRETPRAPNSRDFPFINMTHSDIGATLSVAQETATRLLSDLETRKVLRLQRGRIKILDVDRLMALAGYPGSEVDLERPA